jgi:hypothetical protein
MTDSPSTAAVYRFSPSAIETFRACPARWGFARLPGGVREPGNDATAFGTEVHTQREIYLAAAVRGEHYEFPDTRAGVVARALSEHLPSGLPPYGYYEADHEYSAEGVVLHGLPDMAWPEARGVPDITWPDARKGVAVVADYKTTGSMRYAKLERDALFGHPQAPLYALMNMRKWGFDFARCLWLYGERPPPVRPPSGWSKPRVVVSDHTISRDEATERVHLLLVPPAKEMLAAYQSGMTAAQAGELPKNLRHCRSFGRLCPYYNTCNPKKESQMEQANPFLAGLGLGTTPTPVNAPIAPATEVVMTTPNGPVVVSPVTDVAAGGGPPAVNPPEAAGKKGKGRAAAPAGIDAATIDAIAEAVVDKLALRLMRNVP